MAITYPRELPSYHVSQCWFEYAENVVPTPIRDNSINLSQITPESWTCNVVTGLLHYDVQAEWSAWRKSLRGGLKTFLAYDVKRKNPLAYMSANQPSDISGAWDGTAIVTSLGLSGALGLSGLPSTYQFKAGDRIGLEENGYYGYYEVVESVAAVAGAATVSVLPFLHDTIFSLAAVARIWRPKCQFIIDWQSWTEPGTREAGPISFRGFQRL